MTREAVPVRAVRVRPGRARTAASWIAGVIALGLAPAVLGQGLSAPALLGPFVTLVVFVLSTLVSGFPRSVGSIALVEEGLRIPGRFGESTLRRDDVESAYEVDGGVVLLLKSGAAVEIGLVDVSPDAVLAHLGLTLDHAALTAPLRGQLGGFTRGLLTFMFSLPFTTLLAQAALPRGLMSMLGMLGALGASFALALFVASTLRPRLVVGVDGLRLVGVLRPKFIPYGSIRDVKVVDNAGFPGLFIHAGERTHLLPLVGQSADQLHALTRRIEEGRRRHRGAAGVRDLSVLDRGGMTMPAWRESLRRLAHAAGDFRSAALDARDFEEVLADPAAPIERRVGAALALREGDVAAREKIRIAAETSAEPRVRVALAAAADEDLDDDAVESALPKRASV